MTDSSERDSRDPDLGKAMFRAISFHREGKLLQAQRLYEQVLLVNPDHFDALCMLGLVHAAQNKADEAIRLIRLALQQRPDSALALYNLGVVLHQQKKCDEAIDCYMRALSVNPEFAEASNNCGNALIEQGMSEEAIACYRKALVIKPNYAEARNNLGNVFRARRKFDEAIEQYQDALAINPDYYDALRNLGNTFADKRRFADAIACYQKAIAINPDSAEAHNDLGNVFAEQNRVNDATASYRRSLALAPEYADAHYNLGTALLDAKKPDEAIWHLRKTLAIKPDHEEALGLLIRTAMQTCNWRELERLEANLRSRISNDRFSIDPWVFVGISDSPLDEFRCARNYVERKFTLLPTALYQGAKYGHGKIRVAYLSAAFHEHATSYLMAELFELHDRERFEVIGVSFGVDDQSTMRRRLISAFDRFIDIRLQSDEEAARLLSESQVDIAVDLKGYTQDARMGILAYRPAPVQVNYLGYPGTTGAKFIDYILGDRIVTPFDQQAFFSEHIVQLPDSYQVNDSKRMVSSDAPLRKQCGLPENGFVFCSFNKTAKILPQVFEIWMRLMRTVDGSVLWLMGENENLKKEAKARGVDPDRLVFAPRISLEKHLARHRLADLFLDTLPYNAHTTASDALWAGLPVLTCLGTTFAGRVAASLLNALGMPELITNTLEEYETLALELAADRKMLADIKSKLAQNRTTYPLFDTVRFRRHIEAAYVTMVERHQRGEPPASFAVPAI